MRVCAIKDKTAVVVVASYRSVSRNPVRFKALCSISIDFIQKRNERLPFCIFFVHLCIYHEKQHFFVF